MARRLTLPPGTRESLAAWYPAEVLDRVPFLQGSLLGRLFGSWGQAAVTINGTVHLTPHAPPLESLTCVVLAAHELWHVGQQREMGWWRFLARYVVGWRPAHVREGWRHPLEAPAYARGDEVRRALGGQG